MLINYIFESINKNIDEFFKDEENLLVEKYLH